MSLCFFFIGLSPSCFPRVSGDEPGQAFTFPAGFEFSPRERG